MTQPEPFIDAEPIVHAAAVADAASKQPKLKDHWWQTIAAWHTDDDKLWREIYARTVATLLAAFIAYLIAVVAADADPKPLRLILLILAAGSFVGLTWSLVVMFTPPIEERPVTPKILKFHAFRGGNLGIMSAITGILTLTFFNLYRQRQPIWPRVTEIVILTGVTLAAALLGIIMKAVVRAVLKRRRQRQTKSDEGSDTKPDTGDHDNPRSGAE